MFTYLFTINYVQILIPVHLSLLQYNKIHQLYMYTNSPDLSYAFNICVNTKYSIQGAHLLLI